VTILFEEELILKKRLASVTGFVLAMVLTLSLLGVFNPTLHAAGLAITGSGGWNETAYVEWSPVSNAQGYNVYVKPASASDAGYQQIDNELIRKYPSNWRADAVGLAAGSYILKVEALLSGGSKESVVTSPLTVKAFDRSGFAF
jgi:pectate lyase